MPAQPERRKLRTPFSYRVTSKQHAVMDSTGGKVANVITPEHARFICTACNNFDGLLHSVMACRAEFEDSTMFEQTREWPAYVAMVELTDRINRELGR